MGRAFGPRRSVCPTHPANTGEKSSNFNAAIGRATSRSAASSTRLRYSRGATPEPKRQSRRSSDACLLRFPSAGKSPRPPSSPRSAKQKRQRIGAPRLRYALWRTAACFKAALLLSHSLDLRRARMAHRLRPQNLRHCSLRHNRYSRIRGRGDSLCTHNLAFCTCIHGVGQPPPWEPVRWT